MADINKKIIYFGNVIKNNSNQKMVENAKKTFIDLVNILFENKEKTQEECEALLKSVGLSVENLNATINKKDGVVNPKKSNEVPSINGNNISETKFKTKELYIVRYSVPKDTEKISAFCRNGGEFDRWYNANVFVYKDWKNPQISFDTSSDPYNSYTINEIININEVFYKMGRLDLANREYVSEKDVNEAIQYYRSKRFQAGNLYIAEYEEDFLKAFSCLIYDGFSGEMRDWKNNSIKHSRYDWKKYIKNCKPISEVFIEMGRFDLVNRKELLEEDIWLAIDYVKQNVLGEKKVAKKL